VLALNSQLSHLDSEPGDTPGELVECSVIQRSIDLTLTPVLNDTETSHSLVAVLLGSVV
jgi:hypothetical protein